MNPKFKNFIKRTAVLSSGFFAIATATFFLKNEWFLFVYPIVTVFFAAITLTVHYFLLRSIDLRLAKFSTNFMLTTGLKLIIYLIFIVIYLLFYKHNALLFTIFFLLHYMSFTFFEIATILNDIKNQIKQK